jgi:hypothetical protein
MVSNVLNMSAEELLVELRRMRDEYAGDADYQAARAELPEDWPI